MEEEDMRKIVNLIDEVLSNKNNEKKIQEVKEEVNSWSSQFPLYK
jgi:glycine hydroxymethyltransferase